MKRKKKKETKEKPLDKSEQPETEEKIKKLAADSPSKNLAEQIKKASEGLYYISETDAEILPFTGATTKTADAEEVLKQTGAAADSAVEERGFAVFFTRLTEIQDWFGEEEKATAQKFSGLKEILENNIRDLKVYKVGKIELDVYVVGLDAEDTLIGIKTKAVET